MANTNTPRLNERLNQLTECVRKFFSESYDTKKNKWQTLDADFRIMEERLCVTLLYDLLGETEGYNAQHSVPKNTDDDKIKYGQNLVDKFVETAKSNGIDTDSLDKLKQDFGKHNLNAHGSDISSEERERKGRESVLGGLVVLLQFLTDNGLTDYLSQGVQEEFVRLHQLLQHSQKLLLPGSNSPEVRECVLKGIKDAFNQKSDMPPAGDFDYVMILPENPSDELIQLLKTLMMIMRWTLVFDQGHETGVAYSACQELSQVKLSNTELAKSLSEVKSNWIFMNGRQPNTTEREKRLLFKELGRSALQMKNIIVLDLTHEKGFAIKALEKMWHLFNTGFSDEPADHTKIFSTTLDTVGNLGNKLKQSGYEVQIISLNISPEDLLSTLIDERVFSSEIGSQINLNNLQYLSAGIKFLQTPTDGEKTRIWDSFYSGRTLTMNDLENNCDVYPRGKGHKLRKFKEAIEEALSLPDGNVFYLYHQPGAGGTSLARRLAYDFMCKCSNPEVLPVFLIKFDALNTIEMLVQLSEAAGVRTTMLIVADDKEIDNTVFQTIHQNIIKKGIHCVLLRIRHTISYDDKLDKGNTFFLASDIRDNREIERFDYKFRTAYAPYLSQESIGASLAEIHKVYDKSKSVEMIFYPYSFCEQMNKERHDIVVAVPDSFVSYWFAYIGSNELKSLCANIAFAYIFTSSRAVDIYSLESVWRKEGISTLNDYAADDINAVNKILKVSDEDYIGTGESTLRAPRYATFAKKILNSWRPAWNRQLSVLAIDFINAMPENLSDRDHGLMTDLFIQQAVEYERDDESLRIVNDRFSPLIGRILEDEGLEGARTVFKALMDKYPLDPYYKIHYARLLFEYAHSNNYESDDINFKTASSEIKEVIDKYPDIDSFHHIAGMYWRRMAKAFKRSAESKGDSEVMMAVEDMIDATNKALRCFENCNELNRGTSSYGYVSTAELIISTLYDAKKLLPYTEDIDIIDKEPYLGYMELLDNTVHYLARPQFAFELTRSDKLNSLRNEYLKLIGDIDRAIDDSRRMFDTTVEERTRRIYGHRTVSLMLEKAQGRHKKEKSLYRLYANMNPNSLRDLSSILKIMADSGDIRSAEQYFHLCRYTRHDLLTEGVTYNALKQWEGLSIEKGDKQHQLMSSFYLYVCYAVKILNEDDRYMQLETYYSKYRELCRNLVRNLNEEPYSQMAFAGNENIHSWDCIIDPKEAYDVVDVWRRKRIYRSICRRENAVIVATSGNQGDCEIRYLKKISFSRKGIVGDVVGGELKNGVIGFRYRGVGLYDFTSPKSITAPSKTETSRQQIESTCSIRKDCKESRTVSIVETKLMNNGETMADDDVFRTDSEKAMLRGPKVIGKIDIEAINKRGKGR